MDEKITVAVLFGGPSTEHEVSLVSAAGVLDNIDRTRYHVLEVGVARDGAWFCGDGTREMMKSRGERSIPGVRRCSLPPDPSVGGLLIENTGGAVERLPLDFVLPMIHGSPGEDGMLQGLLEMAGIPYAGPPADASALCFDKERTKVACAARGIPVAAWRTVDEYRRPGPEELQRLVDRSVGCPCFVKPARCGSSVGISRVADPGGLGPALDEAFRFDHKALIEEAVSGREIECAVLGNHEPRTAPPGEVITAGGFYDYKAKYLDTSARTVVPADLPSTVAADVCRLAGEAWGALGLQGMARIDFFYVEASGAIMLNEVNTIPGFTPISMYPQMWASAGLDFRGLIDELIRLGFERHRRTAEKERSLGLDRHQAGMVGQGGAAGDDGH